MDNSYATLILQLSLLMSPPQLRCPSRSILIPFPQRSPLGIEYNTIVACLLKLLRKEISNAVTSTSDLSQLPGLFEDSKLPRRKKCNALSSSIFFNIQRTFMFRRMDSNHQSPAYQAIALTVTPHRNLEIMK